MNETAGSMPQPLQNDDSSVSPSLPALEAHLAEYQALRAEIEWLIEHGNQYQNFAIVLLSGLAALIAWVLDTSPGLLVPSLLVAPFVFCLLGFLYFRQHEEIYVIAAYLQECVRPQVRSLAEDATIWSWEEFKYRRLRAIAKGRILGMLSGVRMVFFLRAGLFLLPGVVCLLAVVAYATLQGKGRIVETYGENLAALLAVWFIVDATVVLFLAAYLLIQGNLPGRILQLESEA